MKSRFIAKMILMERNVMELRQQWWQQGQDEKWSFLFYHDIKTPMLFLNNFLVFFNYSLPA
jgi:hypothetical protein